jgi:hypothetical protein
LCLGDGRKNGRSYARGVSPHACLSRVKESYHSYSHQSTEQNDYSGGNPRHYTPEDCQAQKNEARNSWIRKVERIPNSFEHVNNVANLVL